MNYYELLGVGWDCSADDLKKAYKRAALKHHPDKGGDAETFKEVSIAYETLNDESKRLLYDRSLRLNGGTSGAVPPYRARNSQQQPGGGGGSSTATSGSYASGANSAAGPGGAGASRRGVPANLDELSAKDLKALLESWGIRHDDCFERSELVQRVRSSGSAGGSYNPGTAGAPGGGSSTTSSGPGGGSSFSSSGSSTSTGSSSGPHPQQAQPPPPANTNSRPFRGAAWDSAKYQAMTEERQAATSSGGETRPATRVKVISMGPSNSGKSCLIKRFCEGRFVPRYISTIGVDYGVKGVNIGKERVKVNFFDLSGHEDFRDIRTEFYENSQGVLMCYDASNAETFKKLQSSWVWEARSHGLNFSSAVCLLCANKCDVAGRQVSKVEGQQFATENGFLYFELSASTGENIVQAFNLLFEKICSKLRDDLGKIAGG
ncbi:unnamed protein product [Amoebophrya sp. A25]|nr:unnamed protein product [Amoebophrya sp. A25]|eukprot:GSA25T00010386001.1